MRVKLLRDEDGATVRLVYPSTLDEYGEAFEALGALAAPAGDGGPDAGRDHVGGSYVVTTESQRARWQLPDLWTSGRARVVDESEAFGLLRAAPADLPPPTRWDNGPNGPASEALRALAAPDPRLDQALEALDRVDLPGGVCETLRRELRRTLASRTVGKVLDRAQRVLRLPWWERSPARFDAAAVLQALERTHGGLGRVKARLIEVLAACPQSGGLLTVEGARDGRGVAATGAPLALVVRPGAAGAAVPCLAGPPGVGKTMLSRLVAAALGRPCAWVDCSGLHSASALHGARAERPGRIVEELRRVGVGNPVFVLDEIDRLDEAGGAAAALLEAVDPPPGAAFRDRYLDLPFDLCEALFVATATRLGSVPAMLRERMRVVELPGYTEAEKRDIAARYLLPVQSAAARADGQPGRHHGRGDSGPSSAAIRGRRACGGWPRRWARCAPRWCGGGPRGTRRRSRSRRRGSPGCSARPGIRRRRWPAARGGRGSPSGCASRRAAARCRSSKRAGWPAPGR